MLLLGSSTIVPQTDFCFFVIQKGFYGRHQSSNDAVLNLQNSGLIMHVLLANDVDKISKFGQLFEIQS